MDTERKEHFEGPKDPTFGEVERFYRENFNTLLSHDEEWRFHCVVDELETDLAECLSEYDLRGAFKDGAMKLDSLPNKYRKPSHALFGADSIYNGQPDLQHGGEYEGGEWGTDAEGRQTFTPSAKMLSTTHPKAWLTAWARKHAPNVVIIIKD